MGGLGGVPKLLPKVLSSCFRLNCSLSHQASTKEELGSPGQLKFSVACDYLCSVGKVVILGVWEDEHRPADSGSKPVTLPHMEPELPY